MIRLKNTIGLILLIQVLLMNNACNAQSKKVNDKVLVNLEIVSKGSTDYYKEKEEGYFVRASVLNIQDTTISFVIMSCSWPSDNWVTNNKSIYITGRGCDANSPVRITLKPKQSIFFYGFIRIPERKLEGETFRFAFLYYDNFNDILDVLNTSKSKERGKEVWSNEVRLEDNIFQYKLDTCTNCYSNNSASQ